MKTKRNLLILGIAIGGLLTLSPLWGILITVIGMVLSFQAIGTGAGLSNPTLLSSSIGSSLVAAAVGFALFPLGVLILVISIVLYVRLRKATPSTAPDAGRESVPRGRHTDPPCV